MRPGNEATTGIIPPTCSISKQQYILQNNVGHRELCFSELILSPDWASHTCTSQSRGTQGSHLYFLGWGFPLNLCTCSLIPRPSHPGRPGNEATVHICVQKVPAANRKHHYICTTGVPYHFFGNCHVTELSIYHVL